MMASSSSSESVPQLSRSEAKSALNEVIRSMTEPNNSARMSAARTASLKSDTGGGGQRSTPQMEAVRHMQFVFPIATQILMDVIPNYGFAKSGEGVIQFTLAIRHMERFDDEIRQLNTQLRAHFLPAFPIPSATNSSVL